MAENTTVPDELFDADRSTMIKRDDWLITPQLTLEHDPLTFTWSCPKCGESGVLEDVMAAPHGTQHAEGPFGTVTPLTVTAQRRSEEGSQVEVAEIVHHV